jgi:hypothetical protein
VSDFTVGFFEAAFFDFREANVALLTGLDWDSSKIDLDVLRRLERAFTDTQSSRTRLRLLPASSEGLSGCDVLGEFGCWRGRDAYVRLTDE